MKKTQYRYPENIAVKNRRWPDAKIEKAPIWCSVDLRDGNQALPIPMTPERKLRYFKMLCDIGFKEIEVGFPSASQDDYDFVRLLIEGKEIPPDVKISVLTQAREPLIRRTVESLKGVRKGIVHCYVATSDLHTKIVFNKSRKEVLEMAVNGTTLIKKYLSEAGLLADVGYEFSPEEFTDTDIDFSVEVCEKVREAWGKDSGGDFILNLPATVERRPPYQYADMIEYFCGKYKYPEDTVISVHAHNDQGCAVAATEMALLAGAHRVEGTLFGHGERTGNVDIVTIALNFQSRGIETGLDFSNIASIVEVVEKMSYIPVHQRHPYAGDLVFTAFSGSHQDAIRKGLAQEKESREIFGSWKIPYLHINPTDIGRKYEKIIRINSQSGKGGAVYILENDFGYRPPKRIHPEIGEIVQKLADRKKTEIGAEELLKEFKRNFFNIGTPLKLNDFAIISSDKPNHIKAKLSITLNGVKSELEGEGNGPVSAAVHALTKQDDILKFTLKDFDEQSLGHSEDATAIAYVSISREEDGKVFCGAGEHSNIEYAALLAVFSAINKAWKNKK